MLYRVLDSLYLIKSGRRIPTGVSNLAGIPPKSIETLLAKGRIAEVMSAPVAMVPGYEGREGSIVDAIEAAGTTDEERDELMGFITPDPTVVGEIDAILAGTRWGHLPKVADLPVYDADAELEADNELVE